MHKCKMSNTAKILNFFPIEARIESYSKEKNFL